MSFDMKEQVALTPDRSVSPEDGNGLHVIGGKEENYHFVGSRYIL